MAGMRTLPIPLVPGHRLIRRIGSGTYGAVWLAESDAGEYRAAKIVRRDRAPSLRHFEREYEGLAHYEPISHVHPGLVRLYQVTRDEAAGEIASVMELADDALMGRDFEPALYHPSTLRSMLDHRKRLGIVDIILLARPLLGALEELHRRDLVHRDVKPANVIFVAGRPKLADVGLITEQGDASTCVGSLGYNPPEGSGRPTADIYSFGRMLYEMYTGIPVQSLVGPLPDIRSRLSQPRQVEFYDVILRACAPLPAARYPTASALVEALRPFVPASASKPVRE
jgi:serine/threonine protein kinase